MSENTDLVFLFDVDNTLLDNDRFEADLAAHVADAYGAAGRDRYRAIFEELREQLGYADYLGALQRFRLEHMHEPKLLEMALWLLNYPFADRLYPGALDAVLRTEAFGTTAILSDGDAAFQPSKIARAGLAQAFGGRTLICIHKEKELDDVARLRPAGHYVLIDDKPRILSAIKRVWNDKVTTVFVKQGHYAQDRAAVASEPRPDVEIDEIADFRPGDVAKLR